MKLRRTRVKMKRERGGEYARSEVTVPPEAIRELGWELGVELDWSVEGKTLSLFPKSRKKK